MLVQSIHLIAQSPTPMVSYSQEVDAPGKLVAAKGCDLEKKIRQAEFVFSVIYMKFEYCCIKR